MTIHVSFVFICEVTHRADDWVRRRLSQPAQTRALEQIGQFLQLRYLALAASKRVMASRMRFIW